MFSGVVHGPRKDRLKPAVAFFRRRGKGRPAKPSEKHRNQVAPFANAPGYSVAAEFSDAMTCGPTFLNERGFSALLKHVEATGASTVIVVSAREFAPDHLVPGSWHTMLRNFGSNCLRPMIQTASSILFFNSRWWIRCSAWPLALKRSCRALIARRPAKELTFRLGLNIANAMPTCSLRPLSWQKACIRLASARARH